MIMSNSSENLKEHTSCEACNLMKEILADRKYHEKWARRHFRFSQLAVGVAIIGSFISAAAFAAKMNVELAGIIAAIPGTAIVFDRSFSFRQRAAWHQRFKAYLLTLEYKIKYEGASVASVSEELREFIIQMELGFPGLDVSAFNEPLGKNR